MADNISVSYNGISSMCSAMKLFRHALQAPSRFHVSSPSVFVLIHKYIRTFIHTYIHSYIHTFIYTYIHTYIHTHIHTYTHSYIHTYIHTYVCVCVCVCVCVYKYIEHIHIIISLSGIWVSDEES